MADDARLLAALRRYAQTMAGDYDLTDALHQLTREITEVLGIAGAGIVLAGHDGRLAYATSSNEAIGALEQVQQDEQIGPCNVAYTSQAVVTVSDIATRVEWARYRAEARRIGVRSAAGIPLGLKSERFGALNLYDEVVREWSDHDISVARILADMAAGYMIHERLQDTRRLAGQLQTALDSRVILEQAKGIIAADLQISIDAAFEVLRVTARNENRTLRAVATSVVDGYRPSQA